MEFDTFLDLGPFLNFDPLLKDPLLKFDRFLNFDPIFQVFVHEIGHVLGMQHDFSQLGGSRFCPTNEEVDCTTQMGHMHYLPVRFSMLKKFPLMSLIFSFLMNGPAVLNTISRLPTLIPF